MTDVCPYTLGIQVWDGITADCMSTIIPRNTTIPVTKKETYWTSWDYQNKTEIAVYQGESRQVSRNHFLGNFMLEGIPERKAGEESIDVEFSYNQNGILDVKATIVSTHKDMAVTIDLMDSGKKKTDVSEWKQSSCAGEYRTVIRRGERFESRCKKNKEDELLAEIQELLYLLKKAILEENTADINRLREKLLKDYNRYAVYYEGIPPYYEEYPQRQPKTGEIQWDSDENGAYRRTNKKIGRNDPCPCGSGKKFFCLLPNKFRYAMINQSIFPNYLSLCNCPVFSTVTAKSQFIYRS